MTATIAKNRKAAATTTDPVKPQPPPSSTTAPPPPPPPAPPKPRVVPDDFVPPQGTNAPPASGLQKSPPVQQSSAPVKEGGTQSIPPIQKDPSLQYFSGVSTFAPEKPTKLGIAETNSGETGKVGVGTAASPLRDLPFRPIEPLSSPLGTPTVRPSGTPDTSAPVPPTETSAPVPPTETSAPVPPTETSTPETPTTPGVSPSGKPFRPEITGDLPPLLAATPLGSKWEQLSPQERGFVAHNPLLAAPFQEAADKADQLSSSYANKNLKGDAANIYGDSDANALRHSTWNALMVARAYRQQPLASANPLQPPPTGSQRLQQASDSAQWLADAHEENPKNTIAQNKQMDLHNNDVGRQVAVEVLRRNPHATDEEIFAAVTQAYEQGRLHRVEGTQVVPATPMGTS